MSEAPRWDGMAATLLSLSATFTTLMVTLKQKGILSEQDEREIFDQALLLLETHQGDDPATNKIYELARELLDAQLVIKR